jgi:hypothetical protein
MDRLEPKMTLKYLKELTSLTEAVRGPGFFQEARSYSDSGEFTEEFYELFNQVTKMKKIMKHPKWLDWMESTDRNADTNTEGHARDAIRAIVDLEAALTDIDHEFDRMNGHDRNSHVSDTEPDDEEQEEK